MVNVPELTQENELIDVLIDALQQSADKSTLFASITDDWKESLQDTQEVNKSILESDPAQLRTDLEHESKLLGAFLNVLDVSEGSGSPLAQRLHERWYDLFTRERARNKDIIEAT
jgi:ribosomal protein S17E